jgi:hypothetical protein
MIIVNKFIKKYRFELIIFLLSLIFSTWLMFSTFSYDKGFMQISTKAWSDFASHVPLIRSFSFGNNFPPEYPLFSGPSIKYHFLFYAFVGLLEKSGLRLDYALNIPSILGFSLLVLMIYIFSNKLFKSKAAGILSICFFLFNSSLDFVNFFIKHPLSANTLQEIIKTKNFLSFGPYDGKIISAFWNLNIYTNQRHLALAYALSLVLIYIIYKVRETDPKTHVRLTLLLGIILGLSFFLNMAVFIMTIITLVCLFFFFPKIRSRLLILILLAGITAFPQYLYIQSGSSTPGLMIKPGYLISNLNIFNFINYWWQNLGLNLVLIPLGFIIAARNEKKILLSFLSLFIVGNIIRFSPEIAANHKFFNYFMIIGNMFTAFLVVTLWRKNLYLKTFSIILIVILTLSGIIDFFPILNDSKISLADYPINKNVYWIMKNTPPNAIFLNTNYLYDDASLAGRKIFLGWPYFAWSQGYDTNKRDDLRKFLLSTNNLSIFCDNIQKYKLNYLEVNKNNLDTPINFNFLNKNLTKVYENNQDEYYIYNLDTCK